MYKRRCIIVDQDEKFVTVASSFIEMSENFLLVKSYSSCEEAIKGLKKDLPDIIILDVDFPQMKGPEAIRELKEAIIQPEILVISNNTDEEIVFNALSAGATGYLLKTNCFQHLMEFLFVLATGGSAVSPIIARKLIKKMQVNRFSPLTNRETQVLQKITHGKSYAIIAHELGISSETSKTHIKNIYRKLKVNSKSQVVKKAISEKLINGYFTSV